MNRRDFLGAVAALSSGSAAPQAPTQFTKSICSGIFPRSLPLAEAFRKAKDAGFDGIEFGIGDQVTMDSTPDQLKRLGEAARKTGIAIASLWVSGPLGSNPLNSPDPAARARGVEAIHKAVDFCTYLGCGAMLIVPGRLGSGPRLQVGYRDSWDRISAEFKKVVPYAAQKKVILTPENVWNKFLVSPLEMRAFVDQFHSPWLQTHFDIGNVMQFGYPEDWILTLGSRIKRVHLKDYKLSQRAEQGRFVGLLEGDVNWKGVMAALVKVGYRGFLSPEYGYDANDPEQLRKMSQTVDKILAMA